ncbi:hypothetical protein LMH87_002518 [Akanthomyces muscarius]|uniref:Uncharacterized protein n=1 Tax=Akanthomyces muscarius TaxID=2231603 RepID=A0A9W8UJI2_AKAMU|nr:hypothetical protein LMH87_002518 [Akanthomyces muscarius]KAJ4148029.1 hypothetical protein LMH87_002518 [Akanthomyces muscarius]
MPKCIAPLQLRGLPDARDTRWPSSAARCTSWTTNPDPAATDTIPLLWVKILPPTTLPGQWTNVGHHHSHLWILALSSPSRPPRPVEPSNSVLLNPSAASHLIISATPAASVHLTSLSSPCPNT